MGALAMGLILCFWFWRYIHHPSRVNTIVTGLFLGFALLTKQTWITSGVSVPIAWVLCRLACGQSMPIRSLPLILRDALLAGMVGLFVLNAFYLFEGTGTRLGDFEFCSEMLGGEGAKPGNLGNAFRGSLLESLPVPVPRNYLLGIDYLKMEVEQKMWSFLDGEWKKGSWPHYYAMTMLYKTPESTLLLFALGLVVFVWGYCKRRYDAKTISMVLVLSVPALVCFTAVSYQGGFNHHHRYVLMVYPPFFVIIGLLGYSASSNQDEPHSREMKLDNNRYGNGSRWLAFCIVIVSVVQGAIAFPNYTGYFNQVSGGSKNGWKRLGFSNVDSGQDLLEVNDWIKSHPECRPLVFELDYFGANGDFFRLPNARPPRHQKDITPDQLKIDKPQWWIVSVKTLYDLHGYGGLEYLQQFQPVDQIACSFLVYKFEPNLTNAARPAGAEKQTDITSEN